jgi:hypothetical protein
VSQFLQLGVSTPAYSKLQETQSPTRLVEIFLGVRASCTGWGLHTPREVKYINTDSDMSGVLPMVR